MAETVAQLYSTIAWKSEICKEETWTFTVAEEIPKQNIDGMDCLQKKKNNAIDSHKLKTNK